MGKRAQSAEALHQRLNAYLQKKGLRQTVQRRVIADCFFAGPAHVSIEELLALARAVDPGIGYATVYRTLKLFTECGLADERNFDNGPCRYELSDESTNHHHDHLICLECKNIVEFHDDGIERAQEAILKRFGFQARSHKHEIYGICRACQATAAAAQGHAASHRRR